MPCLVGLRTPGLVSGVPEESMLVAGDRLTPDSGGLATKLGDRTTFPEVAGPRTTASPEKWSLPERAK
jgi:hypothetical protein